MLLDLGGTQANAYELLCVVMPTQTIFVSLGMLTLDGPLATRGCPHAANEGGQACNLNIIQIDLAGQVPLSLPFQRLSTKP